MDILHGVYVAGQMVPYDLKGSFSTERKTTQCVAVHPKARKSRSAISILGALSVHVSD